jgi:hypothetical protein
MKIANSVGEGLLTNEFNGCYEKAARSRLEVPPEPVLTGF